MPAAGLMLTDSPLSLVRNPRGYTEMMVLDEHPEVFFVSLYGHIRKEGKGNPPGLCTPGKGIANQDDSWVSMCRK